MFRAKNPPFYTSDPPYDLPLPTLKNFKSVKWRFSPFFRQQNLKFYIFWSLDQLVVETLGVAFVRTYVRTYVRHGRKSRDLARRLVELKTGPMRPNIEKIFKIFFLQFKMFHYASWAISTWVLVGKNHFKVVKKSENWILVRFWVFFLYFFIKIC